MKPLTAAERNRRRAAYARRGVIVDTLHIPLPTPLKKERIMAVDLRTLAARRIAHQRLSGTPAGSIPGALDAEAEQVLGGFADALGLTPPFDAAAILAAAQEVVSSIQSLMVSDGPAAIMAASKRAGLSDREAKMLASTPRMTTAGVGRYVALQKQWAAAARR